eukprot:TRINITY_DN5607_c0_g1_i3.p1 TRINITY_DN5607_c0_g1~~TRINITY_DN5607_c0_g1_i3.p1  ORF type:complete len:170 (-),score=45.10 TRINITY_DN5607_c0_g1_i3:110-619(-)
MGLTIPTVGKACIVFDLKTGTIILGVINLIGCVIGAIACLASVIGYAVLSDQVNQALEESENQLDDNVGIVVYVTLSIVLIICVFYIIISSLLIHGARTGRPGFLTPWLVLTIISMGFQVLNVIGGLISLQWGKTFSTIIGLVIEAYLFVCVWSFRKQLQEGSVTVPKA